MNKLNQIYNIMKWVMQMKKINKYNKNIYFNREKAKIVIKILL